MRGAHIGNHGVFETTNLGLPLIAPVKKGDVLFFHKSVELFGGEVSASPDYAVVIHTDLFSGAKAHQFVTNPDRKLRKIVRSRAFAPFEVDVCEGSIFASFAPVFLDGAKFPTHGGIDAVF